MTASGQFLREPDIRAPSFSRSAPQCPQVTEAGCAAAQHL